MNDLAPVFQLIKVISPYAFGLVIGVLCILEAVALSERLHFSTRRYKGSGKNLTDSLLILEAKRSELIKKLRALEVKTKVSGPTGNESEKLQAALANIKEETEWLNKQMLELSYRSKWLLALTRIIGNPASCGGDKL